MIFLWTIVLKTHYLLFYIFALITLFLSQLWSPPTTDALNNTTPIKMDNIGLKKKYSSLKMDNITVIKLKTLAKQRGIKGYCKLRKPSR